MLVLPRADAGPTPFELADLRTRTAFRDETGRVLGGLQAEGPALVSAGPYALFLLPTGDPDAWPRDPQEAWDRLPPRVYVDARGAQPGRWRDDAPRAETAPRDEATSRVTLIPAPRAPGEALLEPGERPAGLLEIQTERGAVRLEVGERAPAEGVLLGRYERCNAAALLGDRSGSRAHLRVKRVRGRVRGVATASTGGTFVDGGPDRSRVVRLDEGQAAVLALDRARVRWA